VVTLGVLAIGLNNMSGQLLPPILHFKVTSPLEVDKLEKVMKETSRITVVADKPETKKVE
jgi:hypothetical protein